ncbi:MAG: amino acid ABC transporter permease [Granulosicoccus sp.]
MGYEWDFASVFLRADTLLVGVIGTLRIFGICLVLGLPLGLLVGLARRATTRLIYWPASIFVEFFRNTPVLVQILWFYYALPMLVPFEVSALTAAALGISLNSAAFSAEIFRAGIQSIEPAQREGAAAIGMTQWQTMHRIVLPQAIRRVLPALTNRAIEIFKMSTLASVVSYVELVQQGKLIASVDFNPIEVYTVIALIFFLFLYPLVQATYLLERYLARGDDR